MAFISTRGITRAAATTFPLVKPRRLSLSQLDAGFAAVLPNQAIASARMAFQIWGSYRVQTTSLEGKLGPFGEYDFRF